MELFNFIKIFDLHMPSPRGFLSNHMIFRPNMYLQYRLQVVQFGFFEFIEVRRVYIKHVRCIQSTINHFRYSLEKRVTREVYLLEYETQKC